MAAAGRRGEVTLRHAQIRCIVPQAHVVVVAGRGGEVTIWAGLEAASAAHDAQVVLQAQGCAVVLLACRRAERVHWVPHAAGVEVAVHRGASEVQALHLASRRAIVELALAVQGARGVAVVVEFALGLACARLVVPFAVLIWFSSAVRAGASQRAGAVAALSLRNRVSNLWSDPHAQRVLATLRQTVYIAAVLVALAAVKDTV